jgi:large subunit ribosomal protein L24
MAKRKSSSSIVKGDRVRVIRGNFRDMEGPVLRVIPAKERIVVEGVNMRKRHERPSEANPEGGIMTFEAPIHVSNVMLVDTTGDQASRIRVRIEDDGAKERIAVKTGNLIPKP